MSTLAEVEDDDIVLALPKPQVLGTRVHVGSTAVETYVRDVVEQPPDLTADSDALLEDLCAALFHRKLAPPVTAVDVARTLEQDFAPAFVTALFKDTPGILPRLLRALNGDEFKIVPPAIVAEAAHREKVIGGLKHGWGPYCPPVATASHYLLASCGVPPPLLPPYEPLPAAVRGMFLDAWTGICGQFGWEPYVHTSEVRAAKRVISKELRGVDASAAAPR